MHLLCWDRQHRCSSLRLKHPFVCVGAFSWACLSAGQAVAGGAGPHPHACSNALGGKGRIPPSPMDQEWHQDCERLKAQCSPAWEGPGSDLSWLPYPLLIPRDIVAVFPSPCGHSSLRSSTACTRWCAQGGKVGGANDSLMRTAVEKGIGLGIIRPRDRVVVVQKVKDSWNVRVIDG